MVLPPLVIAYFFFPVIQALAEHLGELNTCWLQYGLHVLKQYGDKPGTFNHALQKFKCPCYTSGVQKYKILIREEFMMNLPFLLILKSFMHSPPILDMIVSSPLMYHNLHICFISSSRAPHLFIFPVYVLGMYLLSERTFSITSSAFIMFPSAFLFYYASWPVPHQRRNGFSA